jgi:HTH-type transcriptional regulator/antitoxin HigA
MMTRQQLFSDLAVPPGEYLAEVIEDLQMSQVALAQRMGRPTQAINEIIKGQKAVTPDTALQLEQVTGVPAHLWTSLEEEYRLTIARHKEREQLEQEAELIDPQLYNAMVKLGWVKKVRDKPEKVRELWRFFGVASLHNLKDVKAYSPAFRVSTTGTASPYALAAWLRKGEIEAADVSVSPFDANRLKAALPRLRELTLEQDPEAWKPKARALLAECGVALVILPHLPKTYAQGATFWLSPTKVVVQMSIRHARADIFWFSLFHELAHALFHGKRNTIVTLRQGAVYDDPILQQHEDEANAFAGNLLIPPNEYRKFLQAGDFSARAVAAFADEIAIPPGIVVGRLHHDKHLHPSRLNSYRDSYQWKDQPAAP